MIALGASALLLVGLSLRRAGFRLRLEGPSYVKIRNGHTTSDLLAGNQRCMGAVDVGATQTFVVPARDAVGRRAELVAVIGQPRRLRQHIVDRRDAAASHHVRARGARLLEKADYMGVFSSRLRGSRAYELARAAAARSTLGRLASETRQHTAKVTTDTSRTAGQAPIARANTCETANAPRPTADSKTVVRRPSRRAQTARQTSPNRASTTPPSGRDPLPTATPYPAISPVAATGAVGRRSSTVRG